MVGLQDEAMLCEVQQRGWSIAKVRGKARHMHVGEKGSMIRLDGLLKSELWGKFVSWIVWVKW